MVELVVQQLVLHLEVLSIELPQNCARAKRVERRGISISWLRQVLEMPFLLVLVPVTAQLSRLLSGLLDRMVMRWISWHSFMR
jgi:hypothetical protein